MTQLWEEALKHLQSRLSPQNFETWFGPLEFVSLESQVLRVRIPNRFYGDWIQAHYLPLVFESLTAQTGESGYRVEWEVDESLQEKLKEERRRVESMPTPIALFSPVANPANITTRAPSSSPPAAPADKSNANLNHKYSFDNFVVGPSNQLAHAASVAAASNRGKRYNPLFIYGGVGLGKTHLVNAVGHRVLADMPHARVLYLSAERFTNEFIWSLQNKKIDEFREKYRNKCDLLLMDDIQFLAGREQTQEEFFHTFNALYHSDRQIVLTSDVYPQQIGDLQERLVSRFQWGLVADIQAPELDTRVAIVKRKAEEEGIDLADEVAHFLAQVVKSNVRELEGTLLRLAVKADLMKRDIDLAFAKEALRAALPPLERAVSVEDIQRAVCEHFQIKLADLKSHRKHRQVAQPRMIAMYLCRQRLNTSYPQLGESFGGKDHTTVISACRKIGGLVDQDATIRSAVEAIERKLGL